LALSAAISIYIYDKDDEYYYEIEDEHSDGATEAIDVASTNAFAEKDAVMIVVGNAHLTIVAMLHIQFDVDITFDAI